MSEYLDPAVEAARRAAERGRLTDDLMIPGLAVRAFGVDSAREALAPIRELHRPEESCDNTSHTNPSATCPHCDLICGYCGLTWPCDTARLIYTSKELSDD